MALKLVESYVNNIHQDCLSYCPKASEGWKIFGYPIHDSIEACNQACFDFALRTSNSHCRAMKIFERALFQLGAGSFAFEFYSGGAASIASSLVMRGLHDFACEDRSFNLYQELRSLDAEIAQVTTIFFSHFLRNKIRDDLENLELKRISLENQTPVSPEAKPNLADTQQFTFGTAREKRHNQKSLAGHNNRELARVDAVQLTKTRLENQLTKVNNRISVLTTRKTIVSSLRDLINAAFASNSFYEAYQVLSRNYSIKSTEISKLADELGLNIHWYSSLGDSLQKFLNLSNSTMVSVDGLRAKNEKALKLFAQVLKHLDQPVDPVKLQKIMQLVDRINFTRQQLFSDDLHEKKPDQARSVNAFVLKQLIRHYQNVYDLDLPGQEENRKILDLMAKQLKKTNEVSLDISLVSQIMSSTEFQDKVNKGVLLKNILRDSPVLQKFRSNLYDYYKAKQPKS